MIFHLKKNDLFFLTTSVEYKISIQGVILIIFSNIYTMSLQTYNHIYLFFLKLYCVNINDL